ncbi:MAG: hypothetical protein Q9164_001437 [Protoblastenia rupestris]
MDAPDHRMILRDIYRWIEHNTDKASDPSFTGWQNSVRHNLSMNQAFSKVPYTLPNDKSKKGYIWVLEKSAISHGIQPTTRYRKKDDSKRIRVGATIDAQRQRSWRRGDQAARRSARLSDHLGHQESSPSREISSANAVSNQMTLDMGHIGTCPGAFHSLTRPLPSPPSSHNETLCLDAGQCANVKTSDCR